MKRDLIKRRADHVGVEVALAAEPITGVELGDGDVQRREPVGIDRALDVTLEHADPDAVQRLADRVSAYFVPAVVLSAILTFAIWAAFGLQPKMAHALLNAINRGLASGPSRKD